MPLLLVLAFIVVPLVELWVIIQVGGVLGFWPTIVVLLVDSILGAILVRREGSRAWRKFREALAAGRVPGDEIVQGALLLFGGALLLTPGFVTDVVGLALVLPITRGPVARVLRLRIVPVPLQVGTGMWNSTRPPTGGRGSPGGPGSDRQQGQQGGEPSVEVVSVERDEPDQIEGPRDGPSPDDPQPSPDDPQPGEPDDRG